MRYPGQSEYQLYAKSGSSEIFNSITYAFSCCPLSGGNRDAARGLWCGPCFAHPCFTFRCLSMQGVPGFELVPRQLDAVLRRFSKQRVCDPIDSSQSRRVGHTQQSIRSQATPPTPGLEAREARPFLSLAELSFTVPSGSTFSRGRTARPTSACAHRETRFFKGARWRQPKQSTERRFEVRSQSQHRAQTPPWTSTHTSVCKNSGMHRDDRGPNCTAIHLK